MKKINHVLKIKALILLFGLMNPIYVCAANLMPPEIQDIRLGMTFDDLLKARPYLKKQISLDPDWEKRKGKSPVGDKLEGGDFDRAIYLFKDGVIAGILLYVPKPSGELVVAARKNLYKKYVERWGPPSRKEIGTLSPTSSKPVRRAPVAVWEKSGLDIYFFASDNSYKNGHIAILRLSEPEYRNKLPLGFKKEGSWH